MLEVEVTDPPSEWGRVTQIYLNFSSVEIHRAQQDNESGWITVVEKSIWINLTRTLDVDQTIGLKNIHAGNYNLIRFEILEAVVTVAGTNYTSLAPSGKLTVSITQGGIQINTGQTTTVLIELNVKVEDSGVFGFRLVPTVKASQV